MLSAINISKYFTAGLKKERFTALDCVNLHVRADEWIGVVGESGSGKTTLAQILMQIQKDYSGEVRFNDAPIVNLRCYYRHVQMIFQNPLSSFSPKMKIENYITEPLVNYKIYSKKDAKRRAKELLVDVGLSEDKIDRYPHELSGGELQRVAIARVIGMKPSLIIFDEATSALDVRTQAQIIELLLGLKKKLNFSAIFISHNIALVQKISTRIYVMKEGKVVEEFGVDELLSKERNAYTKLLVESAQL